MKMTNCNDKPRVSIGLPVFNGEKYLEETLDSILAQTYSNFELIISDNASTDRTQEICCAYAVRDHRVRYLRNRMNQGAAENFNRTFKLSTGEFFKWAAHDDLIAPDFLLKCVETLDRNPSVILCFSKMEIIDELGNTKGSFDLQLNKVGSAKPHMRFGNLILFDRLCFDIFGVIRSIILKKTQLITNHIASDRTLRAELGLLGRFYEIPDVLFYPRDHAERSVRAFPAHHMRAAWFDPENVGKTVFPHCRIFLEYIKAVVRVDLKYRERFGCYLMLVYWLTMNLNWARMVSDLIIAANPDSWRLFYRIVSK